MEPKILLIGRGLGSLEILRDELLKFDRTISIANTEESIVEILGQDEIDIAILGAGLPDDTIAEMANLIKSKSTHTAVEIMEKKPGMNPTSMIGYTNEKAVMWKLMKMRSK